MDATNLCNALRMEFEGVFESKIPLDAFSCQNSRYDIGFSTARKIIPLST